MSELTIEKIDFHYARHTKKEDLPHLHALADFIFKYYHDNKLTRPNMIAYLNAVLDEFTDGDFCEGYKVKCHLEETAPTRLFDASDVFHIGDHIVTGENPEINNEN